MKDEIKEHMQNCVDREESCLLNSDNTKLLLDCITNLQEENKRLKELCDKYEEEHNTTFQKWLKELKENK